MFFSANAIEHCLHRTAARFITHARAMLISKDYPRTLRCTKSNQKTRTVVIFFITVFIIITHNVRRLYPLDIEFGISRQKSLMRTLVHILLRTIETANCSRSSGKQCQNN